MLCQLRLPPIDKHFMYAKLLKSQIFLQKALYHHLLPQIFVCKKIEFPINLQKQAAPGTGHQLFLDSEPEAHNLKRYVIAFILHSK